MSQDSAAVSETIQDNPTRAAIAAALAGAGASGQRLDANPALAALGTVLEGGRPGDIRLRFEAGPQTMQGNGVVAGGTLAAMIDTAMAMAVLSALPAGRTCATVSLTVNMLRPACPGALHADARVVRAGRTMAFAEARLSSAEGVDVAAGTSSLCILDAR